jgi:uncharacterized protein DUF4129
VPLPRNRARKAASIVVCVMAALSIHRASRAQEARTSIPGPTTSDITRALEQVRTDPNLAAERTIKMLRLKSTTAKTQAGLPGWLIWLQELFRWIAQSARLLVWAAAAGLAAVLITYLMRIVRSHPDTPSESHSFAAPTHVRDLDIRPETIPRDIGAAARALWDSGDHRSALALLYRGMLSRLTHLHRVPIRSSTTEADCLALATNHLTPPGHAYASRLVRVWQRVAYGGENVQSPMVYLLCDDFAGALEHTADADSAPRGAV